MEPVVREAALGDAAQIAEIHVATWKHAYRYLVPRAALDSLSVDERVKDWKKRLQATTRITYVLELEGSIVGWASVGPARDEDQKGNAGELYAIYMAPSFIGRRLGQVLFAHCESELQKDRYPIVTVWVLEANLGARRFYQKAGFQPDGATKSVLIGGASLAELRYSKRLPVP
jgi:GNAT superfamily N-acetyltransferase